MSVLCTRFVVKDLRRERESSKASASSVASVLFQERIPDRFVDQSVGVLVLLVVDEVDEIMKWIPEEHICECSIMEVIELIAEFELLTVLMGGARRRRRVRGKGP